MNQAYHTAMRNGRRVYHDPDTDTIRTWPENYCLAARRGPDERWFAYVDAQCPIPPACVRAWLCELDGLVLDEIVAALDVRLTLVAADVA